MLITYEERLHRAGRTPKADRPAIESHLDHRLSGLNTAKRERLSRDASTLNCAGCPAASRSRAHWAAASRPPTTIPTQDKRAARLPFASRRREQSIAHPRDRNADRRATARKASGIHCLALGS